MSPMIAFLLGLAVASCVPGTLSAAVDGKPWLLLLGGMSAMAPDWIARLRRRPNTAPDLTFTPDPLAPSPDEIADAVRSAIDASLCLGSPQQLRLKSVETARDEWTHYDLVFNARDRHMRVQTPDDAGTTDHILPCTVHAPPPAKLSIRHGQAATLSVVPHLDGSVTLSPAKDTAAPWSHSLACACLLSLALAICLCPKAGGVACLAYLAHLIVDHLGHESCAWLHPGHTTPGMRWLPRPGAALDGYVLLACMSVFLINLLT